MTSLKNARIFSIAILSAAAAALADTPKPTEAQVRASIEAQVLAQMQAKCAKEGKVAFAEHVKGTLMMKCVAADDPQYQAQQNQKPAQ